MQTNETLNSLMYNWNFVLINYCDGASFTSNLKKEVQVGDDIDGDDST